jgi:hypothetical protein
MTTGPDVWPRNEITGITLKRRERAHPTQTIHYPIKNGSLLCASLYFDLLVFRQFSRNPKI